MKNKKMMIGVISILTASILTACGGDNEEMSPEENDGDTNMESGSDEGMNHEGMDEEMNMDHSSSGEVPDELEEAENPTYEMGSEVIIDADHMEGMEGAEATIAGAYNTTAYTVSYTPTTGGEEVTDHKWVIREEIEETEDEMLKPETEVTIEASHMEGMEGAKAKIDSSEETTVYMVDFTPTTDGEEITNHKWVTENELSAE